MKQNINNESKIVAGYKQTRRALSGGEADKVIIARDAEEKVTAPLIRLCEASGVKAEFVDTMRELGDLCGLEVKASSAVVLK